MGFVDRLREGIFRMRVVPKQTAEDITEFTDEKHSVPNQIGEATESGKRVDLSDLSKITNLKGDRNTKYEAFEEMVADGRIGAAVEMYANDTVQYNSDGKIIWVESDDADVAAYGNKLLDDLNIAQNIWSYAYCMWLYGDVYIETFENTSNNDSKPTLLLEPNKFSNSIFTQKNIQGAKLERYVEKVPNSAEIYDLQYKGKTAGFVRSYSDIDNTLENNTYLYSGAITDITILNPTKFVHICLSPNINRFPEKFKLIKDDPLKQKELKDGLIDGSEYEGSSGANLTFSVKSGQSILENVYGAYQTLKLKEDSVLLERITKSSITRIIQVELGDLPEAQKKKKLQEIKQQIEQQMIINKNNGSFQSRAGAQPLENILYTTTKDGKGVISTVNIGGDVDIGDLGDVEDSENKVYGALLTPKAILGADMEGSGLSNGGSLTELNTTYARRIKRGQVAICSAMKNLINIFALSEGLGQKIVNNFEVKLTPIITVEDNRRDELLQTKIRNVNDILSLMDGLDNVDEEVKLKMIIEWLTSYLNQQDIVDILNDHIKTLEEKENTEEDLNDESESENEENIEISERDERPRKSAFDEIDKEIDEIEEIRPEPELASEVNLSEIEGEDLV